MNLAELVYSSEIAPGLPHDEILRLVDRARICNRRHGISGLLLHQGPYFVQLIEGKPEEVIPLYSRIQHDPRHRHCHVLHVGSIDQRSFPEWDLGWIDLSKDSSTEADRWARLLHRGPNAPSAGLQAMEEFLHQASPIPV